MLLRHLTRAAGVLALVAGLLSAVTVGSASACQCYPGEQEPQRYARATHVFTGVVVDKVRDPLQHRYTYTLKVGTEYKGDVPDFATVLTYDEVSACGLTSLVVGVEYLVFATGYNDVYWANSCGGTRPASLGPPVTGLGDPAAAAIPSPCDLAAV
ncbi:MAG: hypothetical protein HOV94_41540 [Saccharothrix sp.]|nr:hypothetical protein [Saccharothrix sp.]